MSVLDELNLSDAINEGIEKIHEAVEGVNPQIPRTFSLACFLLGIVFEEISALPEAVYDDVVDDMDNILGGIIETYDSNSPVTIH